MKVFISWSGSGSRGVAQELARWLEHVLRGVETFVSTQDIDAGERWENAVSGELGTSHHAVLCVSKDNQTAPWLLYEAGALGKIVGRAKVIPYTIGFPPQELAIGPISRFQGVAADQEGTWSLVQSLNNSVASPENGTFLRESFELWWPRLQTKLATVASAIGSASSDAGPSERELLLELRKDMKRVLDHIRNDESAVGKTTDSAAAATEMDPLTNLLTRVSVSMVAQKLDAAVTSYALAMIDLDHFKQINDEYGHLGGDKVLRIVARVVSDAVGIVNPIGRLAGDEFLVILPNATSEEAAAKLQPLVERPIAVMTGGSVTTVTLSVGISSTPSGFEHKLLEAGDALRQAKQQGGSRIVIR